VKEEGGPQAQAEGETHFVPLKPEEMKWLGKSDEQKATEELAASNIDRSKAERYHAKIIKAQKMRRGALAELAADHPEDENVMSELLHQLHEVRRRSVAKDAVDHYARLMTPEGAAAVRAKFNTAFIGDIWPK
jgi:hypothetical protein